MQEREVILSKIENIENDLNMNIDRKSHFKSIECDKTVEMYDRLIKKNLAQLEILYWVLNEEFEQINLEQ